jgi:5-methylthioadenosine/S-adenosylhomocysteine deaminase
MTVPAAGRVAAGPAAAGALLVAGADVVTMDEQRRVLPDAGVLLADGRIAAIGPVTDLRTQHPGVDELDARGCVLVPGLVNAHQHSTASPLARSTTPDDLDSQQAIFGWTVPLHANVTADDDEVAATLTAAESLLRGVTTVLDAGTVAHPERVAAGFRAAGIRGRVGRWGWDAAGVPFAGRAAETLAWQEETVRAVGTDGTVTGWVTLVGHALASDELFTGAAELAEALDVPMTWHISPSDDDRRSYATRSGLAPVTHLDRLGVLGPRLLLGHAVWLDDAELEAILRTRTAVASCPAAYLRLGQGYTRAGRHVELARRGGRVALGCDAHNAGDVPDVFRAAWLVAALDRDRRTDNPFRADEAFALATIDGAEAAGLADEIGSIEVGKAADLVILDGTDMTLTPRGDLALHLVWGDAGRAVRDVLVAGRVVVRDRRLRTVDAAALRQEAADRSAALLHRAGIEVPHRWPVTAAAEHVAAGVAAEEGELVRGAPG